MAYFFWRINFLTWAHMVEGYALWVLITYLTDVWKLGSTQAAGIINIWGLGLLSMSTPPIFSNITGTCSEYSPECIGQMQKVLFYTALALIAMGLSAREASAKTFSLKEAADRNRKDKCTITLYGTIIVGIVAGIALPYIKPWSIRFGIPVVCSLVAAFFFLSGSCSYKSYISESERSPLTTVFRVFVASAFKGFQKLPDDASQLYEKDDPGLCLVPHTSGLRCLDKAAIIDRNKNTNTWRLCTVSEVEETKFIVRMLPLCIVFILCGLVSSNGNTFFVEQANLLNPKVGRLEFTLTIFKVFYDAAKKMFALPPTQQARNYYRNSRRYPRAQGMALTMVFTTLCCITAALVESLRLGVINGRGLVEKPFDQRTPMTIFWLLPQFFLLAALDGIFESSVTLFFDEELPTSMKDFGVIFSQGVFGLGIASSALSVYIVGKVSEMGGRPNWFQHTLNKSHLDNYYWTLAAICAVTLVLYPVAECCCVRRLSEGENEEYEYLAGLNEHTDNTPGCCCCC